MRRKILDAIKNCKTHFFISYGIHTLFPRPPYPLKDGDELSAAYEQWSANFRGEISTKSHFGNPIDVHPTDNYTKKVESILDELIAAGLIYKKHIGWSVYAYVLQDNKQ